MSSHTEEYNALNHAGLTPEVMKEYLDTQGKVVRVFRKNYLGSDFIEFFLKMHNLNITVSESIKL